MGESQRLRTLEYLRRIPEALPDGKVLVHNSVKPRAKLGDAGFRAWLEPAGTPGISTCCCGWAPALGQHYRYQAR